MNNGVKMEDKNFQKSVGSDILFKLTMFVTIIHALFIFWDFLMLIPFVSVSLKIAENKIVSTGTLSTLYFALLGVYAGHKELKRWTSAPENISEEILKRSQRGEMIVSGWVIFCVIAIIFWQLHVIQRLPNELFRTTLQVIGVIFGTHTSKSLYSKKQKKALDEMSAMTEQDKEAQKIKIIEIVKSQGKIDNKTCQDTLKIDRYRAYYLFSELIEEGKLVKVDKTSYRLT